MELFKACKKCFFVSVSCCPKTELCFLFFFLAPLFFFLVPGGGQTKTHIQSQIEYTLIAHKNGGYKRKNFSREREEMNASSSSVVLSSFSFFSVSVSF